MTFDFFSDFLHFDISLLLLTVALRGYLISISYCLFYQFSMHLSYLIILPSAGAISTSAEFLYNIRILHEFVDRIDKSVARVTVWQDFWVSLLK